MDGNIARFAAIIALCLLASSAFGAAPGSGADSREIGEKGLAAAAGTSVDFAYSFDADGKPVFSQTLSWEGDENAFRYEIEIKDSADAELFHDFSKVNSVKVSLTPGTYYWKITTYNLLDLPEVDTGWVPITVIKAEQPVLEESSPAAIYMDSLEGNVKLSGAKLVEGARVFMRSESGREIEGKEVSRTGDEAVVVVFPDPAYRPGLFDLVVVNPGGLNAVLAKSLRIRFQRPIDLLASVGYAPAFFFGDESFFAANYDDPAFLLGAAANVDFFFVKDNWGFVGVSAEARYHRLTGGNADALLTSDYLFTGLTATYKYRFTRAIHVLARVGGGVAMSYHAFDYSGFAGPTTSSVDPYFTAGLAMQVFFPNKLFLEFGADWRTVLGLTYAIYGVVPSLRIGYQLF